MSMLFWVNATRFSLEIHLQKINLSTTDSFMGP